MQYVLDDTQFTLRYWDWTREADRDVPFDNDKLGSSSTDDHDAGTVMGELMNDWYTVCSASDKSVCNPTIQNPEGVNRCPDATKCDRTSTDWPDSRNVSRCLMIDQFRRDTTDNDISNKYDKASFSNYLEGFTIDDLCDDGNELCDKDYISSEMFPRNLHNQVSLS